MKYPDIENGVFLMIENYPGWARQLARKYLSRTLNQFIIHGNVHAETFIYYLLSSSSNAAVKKWLSKNKKTLDTFFESVNGSIKEQREVVSLAQFGYTKPVQAWYYNDNTLSAVGEYTSNEIRKGVINERLSMIILLNEAIDRHIHLHPWIRFIAADEIQLLKE